MCLLAAALPEIARLQRLPQESGPGRESDWADVFIWGTFPGIPLEGHICALKRGEQKFYWRVERLVKESKGLPVGQSNVKELIEKVGNGTWFGPEEKPTIKAMLSHVERALKADLSFPLIISSDGKVMDGGHRLMAAFIKGMETLPSVRFERDPEPDYVEEITFKN